MTEPEFDVRSDVLALLKAFVAKDRKQITRLADSWTQAHVSELIEWALDDYSQSYDLYPVGSTVRLPEDLSAAVLQMVSLLDNGNPSLVAKAIFLTL